MKKLIIYCLLFTFLCSFHLVKGQCNIGFDMNKTGPFCLNSDTVQLSAWDTLQTGGCLIDPGFLFYINLDSKAVIDNNITFYDDGSEIAFFDGNDPSFQNNSVLKVWSWFFDNTHSFSFQFCDKSYDGEFKYKIYDRATKLLLDSGTIYGYNGCTTIDIPHLSGKAIYSGPGVTTFFDGSGIFVPADAGPGTHVITYSWNNEKGISGNYSRTVVVNPLPTINLGKDTTLCNGKTITFHGGNPNYKYKWSNNSSKDSLLVNKTGTYSVTATDNIGCTNVASVNVIADPFKVNLGNTKSLCPGSAITLDAGISPATYTWNDNSHNKLYTVSTEGTYSVTVSDMHNCISSDTVNITYYPVITINLGNDKTIDLDTTIILHAGSDFNNYKWQDGSSDSTFSVNSKGKYWVSANDKNGCKASDTVNIKVACFSKDVFVPNVFTPGNSSSICNSYFRAEGRCLGKTELSIFNRWGEKIYSNNYDLSAYSNDNSCDDKSHTGIVGKYSKIYYYILWDGKDKTKGKMAAEGTYFYILRYHSSDENLKTEITKKGSVNILR